MTPLQTRILAGIQVTAEGCWIWTKARTVAGYGEITVPGRHIQRAHRVSYEQFVGPIPDGFVIDHLCRTPACVNPTHLEPVTQWVNVLRGRSARPNVSPGVMRWAASFPPKTKPAA